MKIRLSLVLFVLFVFAAVWAVSVMSGYAAIRRPRAGVHESGRAEAKAKYVRVPDERARSRKGANTK
ncbi:MAG: hypothetical protein H0X14_12160 [Acidobacteria bacterium]|nr:hypothetical protein [Acidobacteriota bacterium]